MKTFGTWVSPKTYEMKFKIHVLFQKERYLGFDTFKSVDISCSTPLQRFVGLNYLYWFLLCRHVASKGGGADPSFSRSNLFSLKNTRSLDVKFSFLLYSTLKSNFNSETRTDRQLKNKWEREREFPETKHAFFNATTPRHLIFVTLHHKIAI